MYLNLLPINFPLKWIPITKSFGYYYIPCKTRCSNYEHCRLIENTVKRYLILFKFIVMQKINPPPLSITSYVVNHWVFIPVSSFQKLTFPYEPKDPFPVSLLFSFANMFLTGISLCLQFMESEYLLEDLLITRRECYYDIITT